jgi:hypothetical protein
MQRDRAANLRHPRPVEAARSVSDVTVFWPQPLSEYDFRAATGESWERRVEHGRAIRAKAPRESHGTWMPARDRPDPVEVMLATEAGRQQHLLSCVMRAWPHRPSPSSAALPR